MLQYAELIGMQLSDLSSKQVNVSMVMQEEKEFNLASIKNAIFVFYPGPSDPQNTTCAAPSGWGKSDADMRAPGCSKQNLAYQNAAPEFETLGFDLYLISPKPVEIQTLVHSLKNWPPLAPNMHLLHDIDLSFTKLLGIRTFTATDGNQYPDPVTFIVQNGKLTDEIYLANRADASEATLVLTRLHQLGYGRQATVSLVPSTTFTEDRGSQNALLTKQTVSGQEAVIGHCIL